MKIQDALIAWNEPCDNRDDDNLKFLDRVLVVRKIKPFPTGWAFGYKSTYGACCADLCVADDAEAM